LEWCAQLFTLGRIYLRRLWWCLPTNAHNSQRLRLSREAKQDLQWWLTQLEAELASKPLGISSPIWNQVPPSRCRIFSDAGAPDKGFAVLIEGCMYQGRWNPGAADKSSAWRELVPVLFTVRKLKQLGLSSRIVVITTDNTGNVFSLNRGTCKAPDSFPILKRVCQEAHEANLLLLGDWVPRLSNILCDYFSKHFLVEDGSRSEQDTRSQLHQ
jgi:hypothetical protein